MKHPEYRRANRHFLPHMAHMTAWERFSCRRPRIAMLLNGIGMATGALAFYALIFLALAWGGPTP